MKESFVLYTDMMECVEFLSDESAGKLLKAIMFYETTGEMPAITGEAAVAFLAVKTKLDKNREKYQEKCERRRENGQKGGRPKKDEAEEKANGFSDDEEKAKKANGFFEKQKKQMQEKKADTDTDTDTDTENINTVILREREKEKEQKHKYGAYKNVLLTDAELDVLKTEFPNDYQKRIDRLSEYIEQTGKHYKSHLATIRVWARKDFDKQEQARDGTAFSDNSYDSASLEMISRRRVG